MQTVFDTADNLINGVDGVNGLLDQAQEVLDVDVNATDLSNDITVSLRHVMTHTASAWPGG